MEFKLPEYVIYCLDTIENNGFEAWCVGGAVRDHLMGKTPFDYDITTNAKPEDVINLFPKTVPTGLQHGTVTVVTDGGNVEITTYRADGEYLDHRSPVSVTFVNTVDADLSRRDFSMTAICYNPKKGFYDPENGIADINSKTIR
ncbi:MAG: polynucleotide adenylyltransferase, partial [Clostridia bacterium]|nr:polynucleotide adenylyltransferase [Clostridia bacterium]